MPLVERYRTALVTGAGSGLGAAFTTMLLDEGVHVWGTSRDPSKLPARSGFSAVALELADSASAAAAWTKAERDSGGIDLLINNAGGGLIGRFAATPAERWERQIQVLFHGPVRLARHAFETMRARRRGCIVNVSSVAAQLPTPFLSSYNASKAALAAWSESLVVEASGTGVLVVDFRPGDHRTDFNRALEKHLRQEGDEDVDRVMRRLDGLLNRAPRPEHAARRLRSALAGGRSGPVYAGSFFQTRIATVFDRLVPRRISRFALRRYYRLD